MKAISYINKTPLQSPLNPVKIKENLSIIFAAFINSTQNEINLPKKKLKKHHKNYSLKNYEDDRCQKKEKSLQYMARLSYHKIASSKWRIECSITMTIKLLDSWWSLSSHTRSREFSKIQNMKKIDDDGEGERKVIIKQTSWASIEHSFLSSMLNIFILFSYWFKEKQRTYKNWENFKNWVQLVVAIGSSWEQLLTFVGIFIKWEWQRRRKFIEKLVCGCTQGDS